MVTLSNDPFCIEPMQRLWKWAPGLTPIDQERIIHDESIFAPKKPNTCPLVDNLRFCRCPQSLFAASLRILQKPSTRHTTNPLEPHSFGEGWKANNLHIANLSDPPFCGGSWRESAT